MSAPHSVGRTAPLVVIGDTLLDRDVSGRVHRICPDAPAPVFDETGSSERPGGAALAATLAARDGRRPVTLVTAIGHDKAGARLRDLLDTSGVRVVEIPYHGRTPEKVRLVANRQVLLRMDRGTPGDLDNPPEDLTALLGRAAAILVSDYGRGVTGVSAVRAAVGASAARRPVIWDPHPRGTTPVPGVRLVTPNESELVSWPSDGGKSPVDLGRRLAGLAEAAASARTRWQACAVAVTLGADGVLLAHGGATPMVIPVPQRVTGDTCGAGDRFAASVACAVAGGALISEAVQRAVSDATRFIAEQSGVATGPVSDPATAPVNEDAVLAVATMTRERGGTVVATGGCFDLLHAGHVATLQAARALGDCLIVCMNSDDSVRALKGPRRPLVPQDERARLVAALGCVDGVLLFHEPTPLALLDRLRPDVWVKGGDYFLNDHAPDDTRPGGTRPDGTQPGRTRPSGARSGAAQSGGDPQTGGPESGGTQTGGAETQTGGAETKAARSDGAEAGAGAEQDGAAQGGGTQAGTAQAGGRPVLPEAELLRAWGGQSVVMPYLPGHSSTELIRIAQGSTQQ